MIKVMTHLVWGCLDLIYASDDPGKDHFIRRVESRKGVRTIEAAVEVRHVNHQGGAGAGSSPAVEGRAAGNTGRSAIMSI